MSLCDFLGNTSEIVILDFLMGNPESSYTIAEISQLTGLSRTTVYAKVPEMMANGLIEVDGEIRQVKTFKITDNAIIKNLFGAVFAHSFREAEQPMNIEEAIRIMKRRVGPLTLDTGNRYSPAIPENVLTITSSDAKIKTGKSKPLIKKMK
jgi:hypothetical protein